MNADVARAILDRNLYMVLATADADGRPWAAPETRHSRDLAARPELGIVVFDSTVPISSGGGVHMGEPPHAAPRAARVVGACGSGAPANCTPRSRVEPTVEGHAGVHPWGVTS